MVKTYSVTMTTGTPVQLNSVLSGGDDFQRASIWMQPRSTNAAPIYIGMDNTVSSTNYGVRLEAAASGIPPAPFNPGEFSQARGFGNKSPYQLKDFWVLGTTGDFLHLLVLTY